MKIHDNLQLLSLKKPTIVTIGAFDGVHTAHQIILKKLVSDAALHGWETVVITFWPHPRIVLKQEDKPFYLISTLEERIELLSANGVDHLCIIPFTKEFSQINAKEFVTDILKKKINARKLILGHDHHFGKNREGNLDYLLSNQTEFGLEAEAIEQQLLENATVSSTAIRDALTTGNVFIANQLLGRNYSFTGTVVTGNQLGRTIGFPTANIFIEETYKLIPANGVYAVKCLINHETHHGVMNIGLRPTVDGNEKRIEVHIFDFDRDIYGETLKIELVQKIRDEEKFGSLEALKQQISLDKSLAESILKLHS